MLRKDPFVTGEYYHLYNRGIDKRTIFKSENDYKRFIMLLYISNSNNKKSIRLDNLINHSHKKFEEIMTLDKGKLLVSIGAWCLMTNHFHILVKQEEDGGITKFMKKLGTAYSMYFNIKYQRQGALFGGLFKSKNISEDDYLKHLFGYIHLNPLDIKFSGWEDLVDKQSPKIWKDFLKEYVYSSYQDYIDIKRAEGSILNSSVFPEYFIKSKSFDAFVDSYLSFDSREA